MAKDKTAAIAATPAAKSTLSGAKKMMGSVASNAMPKATGKKDPPRIATKKKG